MKPFSKLDDLDRRRPDRLSARRRSTPSAARPARAAPCCASGGARGSAACLRGRAVMKTPVPGTRTAASPRRLSKNASSGTSVSASRSVDELAARVPRRHHARRRPPATQQRKPAAVLDLDDVRAEEREIDRRGTTPATLAGQPHAPAPPLARHDVRQQRRDHHRRRHGHAVGGREIGRRAEAEHQADGGEHQHPVDFGDVDLPFFVRRGVVDVEARRVAELNGLLRQRERAGDDRLRRDDGGDRRRARPADTAPSAAPGGRTDTRARRDRRAAARPARNSSATSAGSDEREPGDADRLPAEVAHVGVERFAAGDREEHGAERDERGRVRGRRRKRRRSIGSIESQHDGLRDDVRHAERGDRRRTRRS